MGPVVLAGQALGAQRAVAGALPPSGHELEELLAPHSVERFLTEHWERAPLYIRGDPAKFRGLGFDADAFARLVGEPECDDRMRVRFVGADDRVRARPADVTHRSLAQGDLTVCADWINDRVESLSSYCAAIKTGLSHPGSVFMTCYASAPGHGFGTHWDCQASFILQIEGSKRWRFSAEPAVRWPPTVIANARIVPEVTERYSWLEVEFPGKADEEAFLEQVLTPGDVLFLPAGTWHRAQAIDYSVALTMACVPMSAADFVNDLVRGHLSGAVEWRRSVPPVPMGSTPPDRLPAEVRRFFEARLAELRQHVGRLSADDLYEVWAHHVASLDTPFGEAVQPPGPELAPDDRLSLTSDLPVRYVAHPSEDRVSVYRLDRRVNLRLDALPLVQQMLRRPSFRADAAAGWLGAGFDWSDVRPALAALAEAGILRVEDVRALG